MNSNPYSYYYKLLDTLAMSWILDSIHFLDLLVGYCNNLLDQYVLR